MVGIFSTAIFKLSILFDLSWSALNCSDTPTTTDPSCHVLNILGSVSQSWFMLSLIIKGSGTPLLKCFWDFAGNINVLRDVSLCVAGLSYTCVWAYNYLYFYHWNMPFLSNLLDTQLCCYFLSNFIIPCAAALLSCMLAELKILDLACSGFS